MHICVYMKTYTQTNINLNITETPSTLLFDLLQITTHTSSHHTLSS